MRFFSKIFKIHFGCFTATGNPVSDTKFATKIDNVAKYAKWKENAQDRFPTLRLSVQTLQIGFEQLNLRKSSFGEISER